LAEAMIAVAISAITLGAVMVLDAQQLRMVRSTRQSNAVSMALQHRIEQLRLTSWANLTDAQWLETHVFDQMPDCAQFLPNYQETVTLTPWNEDSTAKMEVTNKVDGGFSVSADGSSMAKKRQGRLEIVVNWEGTDKRPRERSYATIISNGGITRVGLMGLGGAVSSNSPGGQTAGGSTTTPSTSAASTNPDTPSTSTPTPSVSPATSSTPAVTPSSSQTPPGQEKKEDSKPGRGNSGGKGGVG